MCLRQRERAKQGIYLIQKEGALKSEGIPPVKEVSFGPGSGFPAFEALWNITKVATTQENEGWPEVEENVLFQGSMEDVILSI